MRTPRTIIIGLDGATFDVIGPLARAGALPAFSRLMDRGTHGPLQAWPNMNSAAAWSSLVTGFNPGQHGVYGSITGSHQPGGTWRPTTAADRKKVPFWRILSASGQRVGIINVPISYPADAVNGFMVSGQNTPGIRSPGFAHPPDVLHGLRRARIDYIIDVPNLNLQSRRSPHRLPRSVQKMVDARSRAILHLMKTRPWDVLMAVFVATDRVQHYYWPGQSEAVEDPCWTPIRHLYERIDSFLGDALALVDEGTTLLVVSDHGFGDPRPATRCLNPLLAQLGLLRTRRGVGRSSGRLWEHLVPHGRRIIPDRLQPPLARALPALRLRAMSANVVSSIEWSQTRVFASSGGTCVFINLRGRQPEGTVPRHDYHSLREHVGEILLSLTDPVSGRRVVRSVHRREEIYQGPYAGQAADLLVEWEDDLVAKALRYSEGEAPVVVGPAEMNSSLERATGHHRSEGVLIAYGPHIRRGETVDSACLYDIAPTILYLQDQPIPSDMDGNVLDAIFTAGHLRDHPIRQVDPADVGA